MLKVKKAESIKFYLCKYFPLISNFFGAIGMTLSFTKSYFLSVVEITLLVNGLLLLWAHQGSIKLLFIFLIFTFFWGMGAEWIGVHTGLLFGDYFYDHTFKANLFGVPLLIGANWALLIYCFGTLLSRFLQNQFILTVLIALSMAFFDFMVEPVAIHLDFWEWKTDDVPFSNYLGWFFVSLGPAYLFTMLIKDFSNFAVNNYLVAQVIFFGILNILILFNNGLLC